MPTPCCDLSSPCDKALLSLWSFEELSEANAAADSEQEADPGITQLVARLQEESFRMSLGGYRVPISKY